MPGHQETVRLTMAQAIVNYLRVQYSERDGRSGTNSGRGTRRQTARRGII